MKLIRLLVLLATLALTLATPLAAASAATGLLPISPDTVSDPGVSQ